MSDLLGDSEHEGTNELVFSSSKEFLNNHQENLETNKFPRVSLEQIPDVVSEMVDITSKNIEQENVDTNSSQANVTESQENNASTQKESNQITEKELPERRRSNRIRRLVVKPDGFVKRSSSTKKTKDKKSTDKPKNLQLIPVPPSTDTENIINDDDKSSSCIEANSSSKTSGICSTGEQPEDVELQNVSKKTHVGKNNKKSGTGSGKKLKSEARKSTSSKKKSDKPYSEASEKITSKEESEVAGSLNTNSAKNSDETSSSLPQSVNEKKTNSDEKSSLPRNVNEKKTKPEVKKITSRRKRHDKTSSVNLSVETSSKEEVAKISDSDNHNSESTGSTKETVSEIITEEKLGSQTKKKVSRRKKQDASTSENAPDEIVPKEEKVSRRKKQDASTSENASVEIVLKEEKVSCQKKQDASTSENAPDEIVPKEDISKSIDSDNCTAETVEEKHLLSPQTLAISCAKVLDSSEIKVPEENTKNILDPNSEIIENSNVKPVKVKSRWWRSSELEGVLNSDSLISSNDPTPTASNAMQESPNHPENEPAGVNEEAEGIQMDVQQPSVADDSVKDDNVAAKQVNYPVYCHIEENIYRFARKKSKSKKQVRRMVCDCTLTKEEQEYGVLGCKEECLNRLLMIECGSRCPIGEACFNKKFQKKQYVKAEIFHAEKKGWGLRTLEDISVGDFLMEFVGEVLNHKEYRQRVKQYAKEKNVHSYFMALKTDEILDATSKGNLTRFINHSCDPNCETQKWTVNGELRVGVFAKRSMSAGEELTLDYQFQRYGREAQKCYCGSDKCTGYIGAAKRISIDAYGANKSGTSRRKKGTDDKKREWEDLTLEEEIEKLNGSKGLRNKEETLKLARLMVRADDPVTRHQLLDIIIKTEEQACLRLFLDYHGLPLMWSWMADNVDLDLKAKILQVLALLPISNKTMLRDSKVMSVVEKWLQECSGSKSSVSAAISTDSSSVLNPATEENSEPMSKKLKVDFSDCETDSSGSQKVDDNPSESTSSIIENVVSPDGETQSEPPKENNLLDVQQIECAVSEDDRSSGLKMNISNMAAELLSNWKNLKELFRIPRLEQQKRREDELEADHKVIPDLPPEIKIPMAESAGDQIQVVISGKTCNFSENIKSFDYEENNMKVEDNPRNTTEGNEASHSEIIKWKITRAGRSNPRSSTLPVTLPVLPNRHFMKRGVDKAGPRKLREDSPSGSATPLFPTNIPLPGAQVSTRPPLLPSPNIFEPSHFNFPPPVNPPATPLQHLDPAPQVMFSPQMVYPQPQVPFMGPTPTSGMPPPTTAVPPPTLSLPSLLQTPPPNVGMPPCQPLSNPNLPPNPSNYLLPPNMQSASVVPSSSQFIPGQTSAVSNYPQNANPFGNQNPPFFYVQQPPPLSSSGPPVSYVENVPVQTTAASLPVQTTNPLPVQTTTSVTVQPLAPAVKEEPKPVKLPKNWRTATDSEGNVYYYHSITRQTQWDPPDENQVEKDSADEDSDSEESESSDTPTYDEPKVVSVKHSKRKSKKRKTTKTSPDTSVGVPIRPEVAKKIKELFRTKMSSFIVHCLNAYRKPDCTVGRITSNEDFKYLARKLTHYTMTKELKQCKNVEDLDCNETVMHKAKDFIKKYMAKYGSQYCRKERASPTEE